jgi:class 3 adenylate cyclase
VITYDGRGTGLSDRQVEDVSLAARVRDLEAVGALVGDERFALFAWSQGTPAAIVYAAEHPERVSELVLFAAFCEAFGRSEPDREPLLRALLSLIRAEWGVGIRTTMGFTHPDADLEEQRQALHYLGQSSTGDVAARILEEGIFDVDVCDYLPRIKAPALVLHRRHDNAVPAECGRQVASLLPDARFVLLEGDHHTPYEGEGDAALRAIDEFLGVEPLPPRVQQPAAEAPVAILFTDMEGSTTLTQRLGDARAQELLRAHNTIVRDALRAHGGSEVKHTGDGIMASFPSASRALECAIKVQRAVAEHNQEHTEATVRVRIGLNAGEPLREQDDLFGAAVQLARRICDQAEPGQILVSNVVRELVAGKGFLFADQGETVLRGFEDPLRLFQVRWAE